VCLKNLHSTLALTLRNERSSCLEGRGRGASFETQALLAPCIWDSSRRLFNAGVAGADGSPMTPWVKEPVPEHGVSSVHFVNPNGRQGEAGQRFQQALPAGMASGGRATSPHAQGRVKMKQDICVGIDLSKDRLDVQVRPERTIFATDRDDAGLVELIEALRPLDPALIDLEATGGYAMAASALAAAHLPLAVINPRRSGNLPRRLASSPRPIGSMRRSSRNSRRFGRRHVLPPRPRRAPSASA
jgi:hypothetical protein